MAYATINPYTEEHVKTYPDATDEQVDAAVAQAHETFRTWRHSPFAQRSAVLRKAAALLRERQDEYAGILTLEMGKLTGEALAEVELSAKILEYYAEHAEALLAPKPIPVLEPSSGEAVLVNEALGVVFVVEPWNFPYYQLARVAGPQLSAGNTMLLKHASNVPQAAAAFERVLLDAGLPVGGFTNLYATRDQVARIIADDRVRGVALTGSEGAGAVVAQQAAAALKKSTLELGGADAFVVLDDADLEKTVPWAVFGRHWNGGQVCVSSKRMIIDDAVYDEFLRRYEDGVADLVAGDPTDPATTLAPLSSQGAAEDLRRQIAKAIEGGATATEVGPPVPTTGAFVQPTILTGLTADNPAYYEEFFGPVSLVMRADGEDDAVRIANDSRFGLGGSVFTQDTKRGKAVADRIETGMVFVNHPTLVKADIPFGGIKRSGYGRELTDLGLTEFVNQKVIDVVDIDAAF
jgi:succinate-semialdehyde dehydrogenase/glutarate-semialdehyde dehydrogenase